MAGKPIPYTIHSLPTSKNRVPHAFGTHVHAGCAGWKMVSWMTRVLDLKRGLLEIELAEQQ